MGIYNYTFDTQVLSHTYNFFEVQFIRTLKFPLHIHTSTPS